MADDVQIAESSPAPVAEPVTPSSTESTDRGVNLTPPRYTERIEKLTGKARDHWKLTGDVDAAEALMSPKKEPDVKAESSPAAELETEADSAPATIEQPKGKDDAAERSRKARERNQQRWDELLEERGRIKAENDLLKKQLAEGTAPKPQKEEAKPATDRPKRPRMADAKYQVDNGLDLFEADLDQYETDREAYLESRLDSKKAQEKAIQETQAHEQSWHGKIEKGKQTYPDFEAVVFSDKVPTNRVLVAVLQQMDNAADVAYYLGKNLGEAKRIHELTDIPDLDQLVKADPEQAKWLVAEAAGIAKAELSRIQPTKPSKVATPTKPLKEVLAASSKPSAEVAVDANAAPVTDPIADALKRGDFSTYKKLMNAQELRERAGA